MTTDHVTQIVRHEEGRRFEARCSCGWSQEAIGQEAADALAVGHRGYSPDTKVVICAMTEHSTWVTRHDIASCNTARHAPGGICGTRYEAHCSCGFGQGAGCHEQADAIARGHRAKPEAQVISWDNTPLTAETITDQDLRDLFARHCECRPIDLERGEDDHAALHDCDTAILHDVQIALGIVLRIGPDEPLAEARERCATFINSQRKAGP